MRINRLIWVCVVGMVFIRFVEAQDTVLSITKENVEEIREVAAIDDSRVVNSLALSANGEFLITLDSSTELEAVRVYSVADKSLRSTIYMPGEALYSVAASPVSSDYVLAGRTRDAPASWYHSVYLISDFEVAPFNMGTAAWYAVDAAITFDGQMGITLHSDGQVQFWDIETRSPLDTFQTNLWRALATSPTEMLLAGSSAYGDIVLWDIENKQSVAELIQEEDRVIDIAFSPDGAVLASITDDGKINLWSVPELELLDTHEARSPLNFFSVVIDPTNELIAVSAEYPNNVYAVMIFDATSLELITEITSGRGLFTNIVFTSDMRHMITSNTDGTVQFWGVVGNN